MVRVWVTFDPLGVKATALWLLPEGDEVARQLGELATGDRVGVIGRLVLDRHRPGHVEVIATKVFSVSTLGRIEQPGTSPA